MRLMLIATTILFTSIFSVDAQPGMYSESEIEFQTLFIEAQVARYTGDVEKQREALNKVIKRYKQSHAAYHELSKSYLSENNLEMAEKNAVKANDLNKSNEWYLLNLADIYEQRNKDHEAIGTYQKLKDLSPTNPVIYHRMALLQLKTGEAIKAATTLEKYQDLAGVDEETSRRVFEIYRKTGDQKKAILVLENLVSTYPDNTRLMGNLASYLMEIGQEKKAEEVYKSILKLDPSHSAAKMTLAKKSLPSSQDGNNLSALAALMNNMDLSIDEKIKELIPHVASMKKEGDKTGELDAISQQLMQLYPDNAKVYALRADILYYQGVYDKSVVMYEKALSKDDRHFSIWSQYMQNLWELSRHDKLKDISEEAIDLFPNKVEGFLMHALGIAATNGKGAEDLVMEAQLIAGQNNLLGTKVVLIKKWITQQQITSKEADSLRINQLEESLYLELIGDLFDFGSDKTNASKYWKLAMERGSNSERLNKKIDPQ